MSRVAIPQNSLHRLRTAYAQFEQLAVVVSEAMGLGPDVKARLDLEGGAFVVEDGAENAPEIVPERVDGVAQEA